jgi:hypothetical protein
MKKNEKKSVLEFEKTDFFYCSFWVAPSALHSHADL